MSTEARFQRLLALAALILLIALGAILALALDETRITGDALSGRIEAMGVWGPVAVVGLMVLHCFIPFPAELLALAAGAAFGTTLGTAVIWVGAMIGAALSFGLARALGRPAVEALLPARHRAALDDWAADQGAVTLLVSRFIPVIAFNLINYAAGLTRVGFWTFAWTTGLGILPLTLVMVHMGAVMAEMSWPMLLGLSAAGIVAIAGLHLLGRGRGWFRRR
ncbi:TVP38/TMEM64 family protein [Limibaculum sp. M0105]|uniref:TVP38/TMEM64 family membrane protein n=1 Tax=Thermohalobaculum xanthum TaxID=2753746 RepID=A0A8J7SGG8_9RHOB|nr:VTT domain-containing protein [Thermohalobaculum xanthum]MBK0401038.1 TVP38/TMEM64 family protein [Thermohalobaculum xanthum]